MKGVEGTLHMASTAFTLSVLVRKWKVSCGDGEDCIGYIELSDEAKNRNKNKEVILDHAT
jgi:hypothetical protein